MNSIYNILITEVITVVLVAILVAYIIWYNSNQLKIANLKKKNLLAGNILDYIAILSKWAVHEVANLDISGKDKKEKAVDNINDELKKYGVNVSDKIISAAVETAVASMKNANQLTQNVNKDLNDNEQDIKKDDIQAEQKEIKPAVEQKENNFSLTEVTNPNEIK